jgi:hypothetical protein
LNENAGLFVRLGCAHAAEFLSSLIVISGFRSSKPGLLANLGESRASQPRR